MSGYVCIKCILLLTCHCPILRGEYKGPFINRSDLHHQSEMPSAFSPGSPASHVLVQQHFNIDA